VLELSLITATISFLITLVSTKYLIIILKRKGSTVLDYFKKGKPMIPRPGGPAIIAGISIALFILFILTLNYKILALSLSSIIAFVIGYIDDRKVMGGYYKPLGLIAAALPIILLNAYDFNLEFPLVGSVRIPILYIPLIFILISIFGNTINSIDVFNGIASAFIAIATMPLLIALLLTNNYELLAAAIAILSSSLAFFIYHRYPSKIFPGDSGVITLGVAYAALAIVAELEIIATIALLPAIINSFFFLSTVKRIVEHRELKARPTILLDDYKIAATKDINAPITLVRLLVAKEPLYEYQIIRRILLLAVFSSILATITIFVM
jgi:UDP-N-acetylglucosamine--dolichyl-phosphate N-acetylglucosaminephosphotransferase